MARQIAKILFILLSAAASLQCQSLPYYDQAINGHTEILQSREPISGLIDDPDTPASLRKKLIFIQTVRDFSEKQLHLPVNDHYLSYVELNRPLRCLECICRPGIFADTKDLVFSNRRVCRLSWIFFRAGRRALR
jgi:predicted aminopeptidase